MEKTVMVLELDLDRKRKDVKLKLKGVVNDYYLEELDGLTRDRYLNLMPSRMTVLPGSEIPVMTDMEGLQAELIHRCLKTSDGKSVDVKTIQSWGSTALASLFKECQLLNGLDEASKKALEKKE